MRPNDPTSPGSWLLRARGNLTLADKGGRIKGVLLEDLCFNAQQAAEKALKAVCLVQGMDFPKTHSLVQLMDILEAGGVELPMFLPNTLFSHATQALKKKLQGMNIEMH